MSNDNNTAVKYYDLHTNGAGFANRFRVVKPKPGSGQKFKPFWSVGIGAFRGDSDNVEYTNFDTVISGHKALDILKDYQDAINDQDSKVIVGFVIGDIYPYSFTTKNNQQRCGIKGRLIRITFVKVNGEQVYSSKKTDIKNDGDVPDADDVCPFDEQLGDSVSLSKDDPDFDKKRDWLKAHGYSWDNQQACWIISSQ